MARTYRNKNYNSAALRRPRTQNEIRLIESVLSTEDELVDYNVNLSGRNRLTGRYIPNAYDDIVVSAYYETDYNK